MGMHGKNSNCTSLFVVECTREDGGTSLQVDQPRLCSSLFKEKYNSPIEMAMECQRELVPEVFVANMCEQTCDYCPDLGRVPNHANNGSGNIQTDNTTINVHPMMTDDAKEQNNEMAKVM